MPMFRKKPVVIEARQYEGTQESVGEIVKWMNVASATTSEGEAGLMLEVKTLEGPLNAAPWDWIIKGIKNEFYPCKPDIFRATYEEVGCLDLG